MFIQLLKGSALVSLVNLEDMTYQAQQVLRPNNTDQIFLILVLLLVLYFALSMLITAVMRVIERRAGELVGRTPSAASRRATVQAGAA